MMGLALALAAATTTPMPESELQRKAPLLQVRVGVVLLRPQGTDDPHSQDRVIIVTVR